jgi:hypothetical protein
MLGLLVTSKNRRVHKVFLQIKLTTFNKLTPSVALGGGSATNIHVQNVGDSYMHF